MEYILIVMALYGHEGGMSIPNTQRVEHSVKM